MMRLRDWNPAAAPLVGLGPHLPTTLRRCVLTLGAEEGKFLSEVLREPTRRHGGLRRTIRPPPTKAVATPTNLNAGANKGRDIA
jgi:hypothetical protein